MTTTTTKLRVKELLQNLGWTTKVLAEKTGLSESYLTHIKNGTRRWNEDSLRKLSFAFNKNPIELFADRKKTDDQDCLQSNEIPEQSDVKVKLRVIPILNDIPSYRSSYNNDNNKIIKKTAAHQDNLMPVFDTGDDALFCLRVNNNFMAPTFVKGDHLIISPGKAVNSGDIAAVEYGTDHSIKNIMQISYVDNFVVLESVNHKQQPIALAKGKDLFRIIGCVVCRYQKLG